MRADNARLAAASRSVVEYERGVLQPLGFSGGVASRDVESEESSSDISASGEALLDEASSGVEMSVSSSFGEGPFGTISSGDETSAAVGSGWTPSGNERGRCGTALLELLAFSIEVRRNDMN